MLFFLYGPDTYSAREKLKSIVGKYEQDIKKGAVEFKKFYGSNLDFFELKDAVETTSLFSSKKIIVITGVFEADAAIKDKLLEYLPVLEKSKDLIIISEAEPDGRDKLFKGLKKTAKSQEFLFLSPIDLKKWIDGKIKTLSGEMKTLIAISPETKESLAGFIGSDLWQLDAEINKLVLFKYNENTKEKIFIELSDLESLVKPHIKTYIFKTIEAVSSRNKKEALRLLHEHLSNKENEFYIFTMFIWQMRNLIRIKDLSERGMPSATIAKKTKISPFVVSKNLSVLKKITFSEIRSIYDYLLELDLAMKTGKIDSALALDMFIFKFSS